jgi:hypothetical protein
MVVNDIEGCLAANICPTCGLPISVRRLEDCGISHCSCGERFVQSDSRALTYVDEIPEDEYLGG